MTRRFKVIAIIISIITMAFSTYGGVLAAQKLNSFSLGGSLGNFALDDLSGDVGMMNVLLIGVDEDGYRSDTIMLVSLDDYSDRVSILSIPRDTMVKINGSTQKINATMAFAAFSTPRPSGESDEDDSEETDSSYIDSDINPVVTPLPLPTDENGNLIWEYRSELSTTEGHEELLINKVKEITGLPIHYFVTVDFDGFVELINAVDGVDFDVPYDMDYDDPIQSLHIHLEAGPQHLDGKHAHDFVRFRHNNDGTAPGEYVMGDEGRVYWQQRFIKEVVRQKLNPYYLSKIDEIGDVFRNNVRTNLTVTDVIKNLNALTHINLDDIRSYQLPGDYDYINEVWYYVQDIPATRELVNNVFLPRDRDEWEAYLEEQENKQDPSETSGAAASPDAEE